MGMGIMSSSRSESDTTPVISGNPDPYDFKIIGTVWFGDRDTGYVVVQVLYPNCKNYEGVKILVMTRESLAEALSKGFLDPHFDPNSGIVARFVPTALGLDLAKVCARSLSHES
jgi:hypothetical protein